MTEGTPGHESTPELPPSIPKRSEELDSISKLEEEFDKMTERERRKREREVRNTNNKEAVDKQKKGKRKDQLRPKQENQEKYWDIKEADALNMINEATPATIDQLIYMLLNSVLIVGDEKVSMKNEIIEKAKERKASFEKPQEKTVNTDSEGVKPITTKEFEDTLASIIESGDIDDLLDFKRTIHDTPVYKDGVISNKAIYLNKIDVVIDAIRHNHRNKPKEHTHIPAPENITVAEFEETLALQKNVGNVQGLEALWGALKNTPLVEDGKALDKKQYILKLERAIDELKASKKTPAKKQKTKDPQKTTNLYAPKTFDQIRARIGRVATQKELEAMKDSLRESGIKKENGEIVRFEPDSPEEMAFFKDIDKSFSGMRAAQNEARKKPKINKNKGLAAEYEDRQIYNAQFVHDPMSETHEDSTFYKRGGRALDSTRPYVDEAEQAHNTRVVNKDAVPAVEQKPEIGNLLDYPEPGPWDFESVQKSVDEPGFAQFLSAYCEHNNEDVTEILESESDTKKLYELFMDARSVSVHVQRIAESDLFENLDEEIPFPPDAAESIMKHFSRICIESPSEIEYAVNQIKQFIELPDKITEAQKEYNKLIEETGGESVLNAQTKANEEKKARAEKLRNDFLEKKIETWGENGVPKKFIANNPTVREDVSYFTKTSEVAKLIEEGVLTGGIGYNKEHPLAHLFSPGKKIQKAIDILINETTKEGARLDNIQANEKKIREEWTNLYEKHGYIRKLILSQIGPAEELKDIIDTAIKKKIHSQIQGSKINFEGIAAAEELLKKARPRTSSGGIDYLDDETQEKTEAALDAAFREKIKSDIENLINKTPLKPKPYEALRMALVSWIGKSKADARGREIILDALKNKQRDLASKKPADIKLVPLSVLISQFGTLN